MSQSFSSSVQARRLYRSSLCLIFVALLVNYHPANTLCAQGISAERLQQALEPLARAHAGQVAVSVRVLDDSNEVVGQWHYHGQQVMPTASLIKLPVMVEAYSQAATGKISLDDMLTLTAEDQVPGSGVLTSHFSPGLKLSLRDAIRLMIRYSDNTATNMVIDHIGLPSTSKLMGELGWPETQLHSKVFRRDTSIALQRSELYGLGSTTAEDMTDLLVRLERGELVSSQACEEMRAHLLTCDDTTKLPRDLPEGFKVAHKTGSVNRSRCAAGVISGSGIKFAICVLTDKNADTSWADSNAANKLIGALARAVVDELTASVAVASDDENATAAGELRTLGVGASGELVESLQRTLNARIAAGLGVDGDFGSATEAAVKKFQLANALQATGLVDAGTWQRLGTLIDEDEPVADPAEVNAQQFPRAAALDPDSPPAVSATAWASVDMLSGKVIGEHAAHERLPIASTTKVMTALLVLELARDEPAVLDEEITFSERADKTLGSTAGIRSGEQLLVRELLFGLLLPSGNDAAVALAEHFGGRVQVAAATQPSNEPTGTTTGTTTSTETPTSDQVAYERFVAGMNFRAAELGMHDSHFSNPHGLSDAAHLSSAADLTILARTAWKLPLLREIVQTRVRGAQVRSREGYTRNLRWVNTNRLLEQDGFSGMKTGTTDAAGACLIAIGKPVGGTSETVIVVLGCSSSDARYIDARNLFAWSWRKTPL